jgi:outer membrane biosynthesis protein TonB
LEDFMTKQLRSLWFLSALALFLSVGISLSAQESTPSTAAPDAQSQPAQTPAPDAQETPTQQGQPAQTPEAQPTPAPEQAAPAQTPETQPSQTPEASAPAKPDSTTPTAEPNGVQSFTGTIVKSGDKYMFQDADSGNMYDIDHQSDVQKFEGKKVKVHGTLDASAKMIHVQ